MYGMEPVAVATMLLLLQYFVFTLLVGKARVKNKIKAPAITGNDEFERYFRVQQNTLEQLIIVLPALWIFGWFLNEWIAAGLALVFAVGRIVYCVGYVRDPSGRATGFIIGWFAQIALILGALIGPILSWIAPA